MIRGSSSNASVVGRLARGFSIVELMMCLVVLALASVGAWTLFAGSTEAARVVDTQNRLSATSQSVLRSYASSGDFSALSTDSAHAERWLPASVLGTDGRAANGWGYPIEFGHRDDGQARPAFTLTQSVPVSSCATLVVNIANAFDAVQLNGGAEVSRNDAVNPDTIVPLCGDAELSVVTLIYRR